MRIHLKHKIALLISIILVMVLMSGCSIFQGLLKDDSITNIPAKDNLLANHLPGQLLIKTNNQSNLVQVLKTVNGSIVDYLEELQLYKVNVDTSFKGSLGDTITFLKANPSFEYVQPVYLYQPMVEITDEAFYSRQWGPLSIGLAEALEVAPNQGDGVVVAILDTGIDINHPEFTDRIQSGYNVFSKEVGLEVLEDTIGHGTHVAGIIGANLNSAQVVGIAPKCTILPVKVLGDQGGSDFGVAQGIVWAVNHDADVINMSLGGKGYSEAMQEAINYAIEHNVVVVVAMSNTSKNEVMYPAGCAGVIAVGAIDGQGKVADFSTRGSHISVSAPGANIYSTYPTFLNSYATLNGTSMAAPHVAGAVALLLGEKPDLTVAQVKTLLEVTADDVDAEGFDENTGYGVINLVNLLNSDCTVSYGSLKVSIAYQGEPLAGAEITLLNEENTVIKSMRTDGLGEAVFYNIKTGTYLIRANGYGTVVDQNDVVITANQLTEIGFGDIAPEGVSTLEGYVVESKGGTGIAEVQLTITSETTATVLQTVTDATGYFSLPVGADTYSVLAEKEGYGTFRYQSVVVAEKKVTSLNLVQPPLVEANTIVEPPTISVSGLSAHNTLSGVVTFDITIESVLDISLIHVRYEHFGQYYDVQAESHKELSASFDTTTRENGPSFIDILTYDVNGNAAEWTIPVMIDNVLNPVDPPAKVLINGCWAVTYGESLGLYRQEMQDSLKNPDVFEINGEEFEVTSAPDDTTILVKLQWGMRIEATGYKVYRATSYAGPYQQIAEVSVPNYVDCDSILQIGKQYYYKVVAFNDMGLGEMSNIVWTEPMERFNVTLEKPVDDGNVVSIQPGFLWDCDSIESDQTKFRIVLQGVTDSTEIWTSPVWNLNYKVYDGKDLVPGHVYQWNIEEAEASRIFGDYSGAIAVSSKTGLALNGPFSFTVSEDADKPIRENIFHAVIDELSGTTDYIELIIEEEGNYELYTSNNSEDACDTVLYLYDSNYQEIANDDDYDPPYSKIITYLYPDTYYMKVLEYNKAYQEIEPLICNLDVDLIRY